MQKTAYEMRISDWNSDVCSSDLERGCGFDGPLEVFGHTAIAVDPCEGAFDDPSSGMDDEAGLIGEFADDFDRNGGGVPDAIAVVGAVGIGARDAGMPLVTLLEPGHRAIAVLHIGRMDQYDKGATIGIDHCMAFASHGLLACVVTTRSACFGGLHALAVDDCRGWCWFSPCPDAIDPNEMMIEAFEYPIVAQGAEPLVYRAPWRKTVGQKPPGTSCP